MSEDAHSWETATRMMRDILKMSDSITKRSWLKSVKKESKTLVDSKTFELVEMQDAEVRILSWTHLR
jgi:hypothetical protein